MNVLEVRNLSVRFRQTKIMSFLKILKYGLENTKSDVFDTSRIVKNP